MFDLLNNLYPRRVTVPTSLDEVPANTPLVYILTFNDNTIVLGHGSKNRASVIFDDQNQITRSHIKSLLVRLYSLYGGPGEFLRYVILCESKEQAKEIESRLHQEVGGNVNQVPDEFKTMLFDGIDPASRENLLLNIALLSSFSGIADLFKWRNANLINDEEWQVISHKLSLAD
jgi:hypothetical protein